MCGPRSHKSLSYLRTCWREKGAPRSSNDDDDVPALQDRRREIHNSEVDGIVVGERNSTFLLAVHIPCFNPGMASIGLKEAYLLAYNSLCCVGWALVLSLALRGLSNDIPRLGFMEALANVYAGDNLAMLLAYSQTAAILEIVHSALGLVRSPVMVTGMQVSSRIVALFAICNSPESQGKRHSKQCI